jgi:M6 family metalloprotease-like protein
MNRYALAIVACFLGSCFVSLSTSRAQEKLASAENKKPDAVAASAELADYRTAATAIQSKKIETPVVGTGTPGYLGISLTNEQGKAIVEEVASASPAARAGIHRGDVVMRLNDKAIADSESLRRFMRGAEFGDEVHLAVLRHDQPLEFDVTLSAVSRPMHPGAIHPTLGIQVGEAKKDKEGVAISKVTRGSPADKAHLKPGEVLLKIDGMAISGPAKLTEALSHKKPGDSVTATLLLAEKAVDLRMEVIDEPAAEAARPNGWMGRAGGGGYWKKEVYHLAVVCIEYPDKKHNPKITSKAWEESLFSKDSYKKTNVTGQTVYGSLADYYKEQSFNTLRVEGKVFDYVEVSKKRTDYSTGVRTALLNEALDKLVAREGPDSLKDYDGLFFLYAGERVPVARGSLYWPHRSNVSRQGKRWPYFICPEGGERMANISVFCHEFGHMLGLPDLYARPENPGSEGLDVWCAMSNQVGNGRPQHFCAWAKEKLGWVQPVTIDPMVKQKLVLGAIEESGKECFKVPLKPDGSEYLLLENRRKKGFDQSLPAEGLLIWRVVGNRPILEESHGVAGPQGPRVFKESVPYPSAANNAFTPFTLPSSRAQLGDGLPVYITNIRRLPDGKIGFQIGYEFD